MGTIWIREFTGGLDTRRLEEVTAGGTLIKGIDCHVTRGGDLEKRAAFVPLPALPAGTTGLAAGATSLVVFGSIAEPAGLPPGVTYQRLQHPDGITPLAQVLSTDLSAGKVYAVGQFNDGTRHHFFDGVRIADWFDGRSRASFSVVSGTGGDTVSGITVGGIEILGAAVAWAGSTAATAAAIAARINLATSTPEYTATASDNTVSITAAVAGPTANGLAVIVTPTGTMGVLPATTAMAAGATATGTFQPGTYVKTIGDRVLSVSDSNFHGSALGQPREWTTDQVGAFFIDMAKQASGAESLASIAEYNDLAAIFGERTILLYVVDTDPANNRRSQTLKNTGTVAPRSVTQFGDTDVFFLDESGIRSLRARDSSNAAFTSDVGSAVDTLLLTDLAALGTDARADAIGLIEPRDGRFWLCLRNRIYVFSYFTATKISAWSVYEPGFEIEDAAVYRRRAYVRSGNTIYVYGGTGATAEYDSTEAVAWLPYLTGEKPATRKTLTGVDVACRGTWEIRIGLQPADLDASDLVATVAETTFNGPRIPAHGESTHLSLRFRSTNTGPAKIGSAVIHFESSEDED